MIVYILWETGSEGRHIEGIYLDKLKAERDLRLLKETDEDNNYFYRIQQKEVKEH